jgi:dihydroorotate dehydrogenase (NAD+) catalytic subunit
MARFLTAAYWTGIMTDTAIDLSITIAGIRMKNPLMVASGTFGYGEAYASIIDNNILGAIVTKGIALMPSRGNPPPRVVETPSGMLNAIGLQNVGLKVFIEEKMPYLRQFATPVIVNFYGSTIDDYVQLAGRLSEVQGIAGLEANISCPNIKQGGISFGTDADMAGRVTEAIRRVTQLPLIVKLTPNVTDIGSIARRVQDAGADALSLTNTFTGMVVDIDTCTPALANGTGGLSGPAIRPLALRMVWETLKRVSIPVIGIGGITTAQDALQFLIVGAQAFQIGTALFVNPQAPYEILEGIKGYLQKKNVSSLSELIGCITA